MNDSTDNGQTPSQRVRDSDAMLRAVREAVREAVTRHKKLGNPVATWRDGEVVWIQPEDIEIPGPDEV